MSRHLPPRSHRSWLRVLHSLVVETAWGVGMWATVAILAVIPALLVRGLWVVALAEPLNDAAAATLSANAAAAMTWLAVIAATRRFVKRERAVGRHSETSRAGGSDRF